MKTRTFLTALSLLTAGVLAAGLAPGARAADSMSRGTVSYEVTFIPSWNPETHPMHYPLTHAKHGLLTPFIGATHGTDYALFAEGSQPTPGLEMLSEMGKHSPLDAEIKQAISMGKAGSLIETDMGSPGPVHMPVSLSFEIGSKYPMVSLVGMIAPSPDWFYGVSSVRLYEGGDWIPRLAVEAYAWDSGGDAGTTYMAEDQDLEPKAATTYSDAESFVRNGKRIPVGTFIFKLVPSNHS